MFLRVLFDDDDSYYDRVIIYERKSTEHLKNDIDRWKPNFSENKLSQCYYVQQKSYSECPGIEHGPLMGQTGD